MRAGATFAAARARLQLLVSISRLVCHGWIAGLPAALSYTLRFVD